MSEEHPRKRRALSWGEKPLRARTSPDTVTGGEYRPPRQPSQAGKRWVDFPDTVSAAAHADHMRLTWIANGCDKCPNVRECRAVKYCRYYNKTRRD